MMGAQMIPQQALAGNALNPNNSNNAGANGMNGSNAGAGGPAYKTNTNQTHSGDAGNTGVNSIASKKGTSIHGNRSKRGGGIVFALNLTLIDR